MGRALRIIHGSVMILQEIPRVLATASSVCFDWFFKKISGNRPGIHLGKLLRIALS